MKPDPNAIMREALTFYADPNNWMDTPSWDGDPQCFTPNAIPMKKEDGVSFCECGDTARAALATCLALPQSEEPAVSASRSTMPRELTHAATVGQLLGWLGSLPTETKLFSWFPETNEMSPCMSGLYDPEKGSVELTASYDGDDEDEPVLNEVEVSEPVPASAVRVREAAVAYLAAKDAEPEKDCWDTETGEEEPGAAKFPSDWAWNDYHDKVNAALDQLRAALSATPEQGRVEDRNPDHVYDKADWEYTSTWDDRDTLTEGLYVGEIIHAGTLYSGPDKWAARIDETEVRWFDTREEAEAAIAQRATTDHDGGADV